MKFAIAVFASSLLIFFTPNWGYSDIVLTASVDGYVQSSGVLGLSTDDTGTTIQTARSGGNNIRNGIFEFDLSAYSAGTVVQFARLEFELAGIISSTTTTADLRVGQYAGNLMVDTGDFADYQNFNGDDFLFLRTSSGGQGIGDRISLLIAPTLIQQIIDDPNLDNLGIRTATQGFSSFVFKSNEGFAMNGGMAPTLTLTTAVPEPGSLAIVSLGCAGILLRRRNR